jgi:hypothetical protein
MDRKPVSDTWERGNAYDRQTGPEFHSGSVSGVPGTARPALEPSVTSPARTSAASATLASEVAMHFVLSDAPRHLILFDDPAWFLAQLDAFLADPDRAAGVRGLEGR